MQSTAIAVPAISKIIGSSAPILETLGRIQRLAPHFRTVLITGETGTGKELVAKAMHDLSPFSDGPFIIVNCAAVTETLFESELFGHLRGSFTGAISDKTGMIEAAHRGTLFLDEIGDMPLSTQAKLLRVLQNQEVQRVGALTPRRVDVRFVAATNHDLRLQIAHKRFREDLFYRLSMIELRLPSLVSRLDDLPLLQKHFIRRFMEQFGKPAARLSKRAELRLAQHSWPGNIRELENVIGHACMMTASEIIDIDHLPEYLQKPAQGSERIAAVLTPGLPSLEEQERILLMDALERCGGNLSAAARLLKIGRDAFRYKARKYQLGRRHAERRLAVAC